MLMEESKQQELIMIQRREESERVIHQLQEETGNLADELKQLSYGEISGTNGTDGELVYSLDHRMKLSLEREIQILNELVDQTEQLRLDELNKRQSVDQLSELKVNLEKEMSVVSQKLNSLTDDSPSKDLEHLMVHNKSAHIQYLEEQIRQYDVSIVCLNNSIASKKEELSRLKELSNQQLEQK